jgi:ribosomal protein S27AE
MDHYIDPAGAFARHTTAMIASGFVLRWQAKQPTKAPAGTGQETEKNPKNKVKYTCPGCGQNAWAKPAARLICGECEQPMLAQI